MSLLDKIRGMQAPSSVPAPLPVNAEDVEISLRRKAGVLAAFGLQDKAIADTLYLTSEQVAAIKETSEFKESCARQTAERTQRLIDLEEGWDAVEDQALTQVLQKLQFGRDPDYALRAAVFANRAQRRSPATLGRVIDASNVGNVITLTVNKQYVTNIATGDKSATVDVQARTVEALPRKAADISSPKRLNDILGNVERQTTEQKVAKVAESLGVSMELLDEIMPVK